MGLSATSGTLYRNLDYWYICYDNEAYGNTGMQQSSATPYGARTATTPLGTGATPGNPAGKKDLFEIWRAHRPPYIATVSGRHPVDLAFAPCPTGWGYDPAKTWEYARLGVECGVFPLKEAVDGEVTHTYVKRTWRPVEEYLQGQGRFSAPLRAGAPGGGDPQHPGRRRPLLGQCPAIIDGLSRITQRRTRWMVVASSIPIPSFGGMWSGRAKISISRRKTEN